MSASLSPSASDRQPAGPDRGDDQNWRTRTPIPYWMDGAADVDRDDLHPVPRPSRTIPLSVRLIVSAGEADAQVPMLGPRDRQITGYHCLHRGDRRWGRYDAATWRPIIVCHAEVENAIRDLNLRRRAEPVCLSAHLRSEQRQSLAERSRWHERITWPAGRRGLVWASGP